ncbi:hypothetical protein Tco_0060257 [Tanacetum coccineum]
MRMLRAKPPQIITTEYTSNIQTACPQKRDYDTWAMELSEHYLEYNNNEVWKVIPDGNSKEASSPNNQNIRSFYKKNSQIGAKEEDGKQHVHLIREKMNVFNCHNTGQFCQGVPVYKVKRRKQAGEQSESRLQMRNSNHASNGFLLNNEEDIDDSLYEYGKYGPQPQSPSPTVSNASSIVFSICPSNDSDGELGAVSDASSTHYSTCQSNDSDGELGTVTDHSVNDDSIPIPSSEQVSISTQKTQSQVPTPPQTVDPSCAQHVKSPRQPIRTPVTSSSIPSNNRQNWNQRMERELGAGYSFERKPCFVCGSLSHLIKNCDYYEKKMAREAALKSKRVVHTDVRQATPAWTNTNRVNKANQFTPRPVQLSNIRPNLSTASKTIKTGRVNVNTQGNENVSSRIIPHEAYEHRGIIDNGNCNLAHTRTGYRHLEDMQTVQRGNTQLLLEESK